MSDIITNTNYNKLYHNYLTYILRHSIFLSRDLVRLTDKQLVVNNSNTFKYLLDGRKTEEIRCVFPSVIGPLKKLQKRYTNMVLDIKIGDIIRISFKTNIVYMFVHDIDIYKDCDIRTVLVNTDYKKVIPDAKHIEDAERKYTTICYKKKLKKYNKFYYIFNIKLIPILNIYGFHRPM